AEPAPSPAAPPSPAPAAPPPAAEPEEDEGVAGGTVVKQVKDLPEGWGGGGGGTVVVSHKPGEAKFRPDPDQFQAEITEPTLFVLTSDESGLPHQLTIAGDVCFWNIGRDDASNDLQIKIDDPSVSALHAKLIYRNGKWSVADKMSANKTYVNGEPFAKKFLSSNDQLRFGNVECMFVLPAGSQSKKRKASSASTGDSSSAGMMKWVAIGGGIVVVAGIAAWLLL
ncbi:MAG: FHA domain-containing protein, partial [Gammaproteobacteria bacterium]